MPDERAILGGRRAQAKIPTALEIVTRHVEHRPHCLDAALSVDRN
ncbi:hypothetical protein Rhow_003081 [Rhodococcus wratislaviensis]|uniref:Uncharacterized protein n=1 Tax=Rhodococcus wratislaviensis TaxID=44752 RepID=A0A402C7R4_RHOWR|nr:hypothetical protein Rhow_003081 [Rhodococcus wratislaviensis]